MVLGFLLTSKSLYFVGCLLLLLMAVVLANRLPARIYLPLVLIPVVFAALFAISIRDWTVGLLIMGRAGAAALTVVMVFLTTRPVKLLSLVSAPLPAVFGELLFFTYRSFFILMASLSNSLRAVRLRRGQERFSVAKLKGMAQVLGMSLVRAWDLAGRQYELLRVRGLGAGLRISRDWRINPWDLTLAGLGIAVATGWYYV